MLIIQNQRYRYPAIWRIDASKIDVPIQVNFSHKIPDKLGPAQRTPTQSGWASAAHQAVYFTFVTGRYAVAPNVTNVAGFRMLPIHVDRSNVRFGMTIVGQLSSIYSATRVELDANQRAFHPGEGGGIRRYPIGDESRR